ncbi:UNVERIFIED_ORG: HNH endonuclease [Idiomarina abyssalis]|uniref:HNH endonuclease signature motif containing protein n=1 Tax=unclassified Idiomarina TaxID=2614829 RepID=UPI000E0F9D3F|nr:HNH endonuclease signature motif containing protein [Idiomarina sp. 017G]TDO50950.1 HNH endonuclease [Idiomarina sp. 017G]
MAIKQKDIKLLWGRSGNRCAVCKVELTQDKNAVNSSFALGEQAHIVGEKSGSARSQSLLDVDKRNSYHNLILLCPNHHTEVDNNEDDWPVEKLFHIKSKHELWVNETLSETVNQAKLASATAVTSIIDAAVTMCRLEEWDIWTSHSLSADPNWDSNFPSEIFEFSLRVKKAIWPEEFDELKRATTTLALSLNFAAQTFLRHGELHGERYFPNKFYKSGGWNSNYNKDLSRYEEWIYTCHDAIRESTNAANWFADVVRRDINPMFFAETGKFLVVEGDVMGFEGKILEYTKEEKDSLPQSKFA